MQPDLIGGRYRVDRAIGRGGMGTVWLCRDETLRRDVAVKQVGLLPGQSVTDSARALREARSSAALSHRNVVTVFDVVEENDAIWLVMEHVPSRSLADLFRQEGPLDPARVADIGAQVADGLAAAHAAGTMHRDVKPGNVLVREDGVAKISDFGIARSAGDPALTQSGLLTGTPSYFSPELARGGAPGPEADVWALGATLYAAVEGHPPYRARSNPVAVLHEIASTQPAAPRRAGFLEPVLLRMLDRDPASRWSMADVAHRLDQLAREHSPENTRASTIQIGAAGSTGSATDRRVAQPLGAAAGSAAVPTGAPREAARGSAPDSHANDAHDSSANIAPGPSRDTAPGPSRDTAQGPSRDTAQGPSRDTAQGPSRDTAQGPSQDAAQDTAQGPSRDAAQGAAPIPPPPASSGRPGAERTPGAAGPSSPRPGGSRRPVAALVALVVLLAVAGIGYVLLRDGAAGPAAGPTGSPAASASATGPESPSASSDPSPSDRPSGSPSTEPSGSPAGEPSGSPSGSPAGEPSGSASSEASKAASSTDAETFVRSYFATAPGGTDAGWSRLGPGEKSQGRASYDRFWRGIRSVDVRSVRPVSGSEDVDVTLTYRTTDGRSSTERKRFDLVRSQSGGYLINGERPIG